MFGFMIRETKKKPENIPEIPTFTRAYHVINFKKRFITIWFKPIFIRNLFLLRYRFYENRVFGSVRHLKTGSAVEGIMIRVESATDKIQAGNVNFTPLLP